MYSNNDGIQINVIIILSRTKLTSHFNKVTKSDLIGLCGGVWSAVHEQEWESSQTVGRSDQQA